MKIRGKSEDAAKEGEIKSEGTKEFPSYYL